MAQVGILAGMAERRLSRGKDLEAGWWAVAHHMEASQGRVAEFLRTAWVASMETSSLYLWLVVLAEVGAVPAVAAAAAALFSLSQMARSTWTAESQLAVVVLGLFILFPILAREVVGQSG